MAAFFKKNKKQQETDKFPDTLLGFGYEFKDGKIRNVKTGEGFQFVVKEGNQSYNQKHYEALGEVVTEEVYKLLESECKLKRAPVPHDATEDDMSSFIFLSDDALNNPDKLLVLIHGSGVVRAGQWSRRLIINDSLEAGSQIPFIQEAQKQGYGVLVTNTNDNRRPGKGIIRGSEDPESHALHVWEHYIHRARAKHIGIIAHSYGGCVVVSLYTQFKEDFTRKVFAVAMTDSVHYLPHSKPYRDLVKVSQNWVCSQDPLDSPVKTHPGDITRVSAGVTIHEQTSWASFSSIFKFLREGLAAVKGDAEDTDEGKGKEGMGPEKLNEEKKGQEEIPEGQRQEDSGDQRMHGTEEEDKVDEIEEAKKMRMDT